MNLVLRSDVHVRLRGRGGRPTADRRAWVVRPDDLVVLDFELVNLAVQPGADDAPARLVRSGAGLAYLIVTFPPQHLEEIAYFTTVEEYRLQERPRGRPGRDGYRDARPGPDPGGRVGLVAARVPRSRRSPADRLEPRVAARGYALARAERSRQRAAARAQAAGQLRARRLDPRDGHPRQVCSRDGDQRGRRPARRHGTRRISASPRRRRHRRFARTPAAESRRARPGHHREHRFGHDRPARDARRLDRRGGREAVPASSRTAAAVAHRDRARDAVRALPLARTAAAPGCTRPRPSPRRRPGTPSSGTRASASAATGSADRRRTTRMRARVRAVWTTASFAPTTPPWGQTVQKPGPRQPARTACRSTRSTGTTSSTCRRTSASRIRHHPRRYYEPEPIDVELLALSSLGAWLDSRGAWDVLPLGLSVEEWRHRATLGRDHYVRVVYRGRLCPWGHRASVVKITERQFHPQSPGNPAYLRQRMFLVVREPVRTYRNSGLVYDGPVAARHGEKIDLMLPFEAVRITTVVSPLLDPPESDDIAGKSQGCFWPNVGGQPFQFHLVGTDTDGNDGRLLDAADLRRQGGDRRAVRRLHRPRRHGRGRSRPTTWPDRRRSARRCRSSGRSVAFAESADPDDTAFAVQSLTFGAEVPAQPKYDSLEPVRAPLLPGRPVGARSTSRRCSAIARTSSAGERRLRARRTSQRVRSPATRARSSSTRDPAAAAVRGEVQQPGRSLGRPRDARSLSSAASRASRARSPATSGPRAGGSFNPNVWFGAIAGAKLFGVLKLARHPRPRRVRRARQAAAVHSARRSTRSSSCSRTSSASAAAGA